MNGYVGYIRVSTVKQGTTGVSLQEQREAILRYAERNGFNLALWLEEMETAAKRGRPVFNQALKLLRRGKAKGIILHKLDRGARNLKDWSDLGELADQGIEVHFVTESLDLQTRGGRLSADIQAVVSADYIRNLREETRKGFYGRLKQGLYPIAAPLGYLDQGKGKAKTIDPVKGPLIRKAFELYNTGRWNLESLGEEMHRLGLRNRNGTRVSRNGWSTLLNNPFYTGLIRIKKTREFFPGQHKPLIAKSLFDRVQDVLSGKCNRRTQRHDYLFRRTFTCAKCDYSLIAESHKGHVYYRCHSKECPGTGVREDAIEAELARFLQSLCFTETEKAYFKQRIQYLRGSWASEREREINALKLQIDQIKDRVNRLTDAYIDRMIDKTAFEERKAGLFNEQKAVEEKLADLLGNGNGPDQLEKFLELAGNARLSYQMGFPEEKRELVKTLTSNRQVALKKLELKPSIGFREVAKRFENTGCDPEPTIPRIWDPLLDLLSKLNLRGELPLLNSRPVCEKDDTNKEISVKE